MNTGRHRSRGVACAPPAVEQLAQLPLILDFDEDCEHGSASHLNVARLCLGPSCGLLVQWHRGGADETFLARRSQ